MVLDHLELNNEKAVDWVFTYNTGVALGTCALLYEATQEPEYMTLACHMAHRSMTRSGWVEDNGVLTEKEAYGRGTHDPFKPNDTVGFKAVLIRQLCTLYDVLVRTGCPEQKAQQCKSMIKKFIHINLQSQQERNTNGRNQYGPWWNGPFEFPTSHSQMAVLDVVAAAKLVESD
jgi:predicted alpha-1,6-mannanase (GH76 family)